MVRKKDPFWKYAKDLDGRFICNFCERNFAGGIPRIKSHLSRVKGRDIDICPKVPDSVRSEAFQAIAATKKKPKRITYSDDVAESGTISSSSSRSLELDTMLTRFLVFNSISFDVVRNPTFIDFVKGVAEYGLGYELPNQSALHSKLIPEIKKELEEHIDIVKRFLPTTGCTLVCNIWCYMEIFYMNIFAYSPRGIVSMHPFALPFPREIESTDAFLFPRRGMTINLPLNALAAVIESIGSAHVVQVVVDDNWFFRSAHDLLLNRYPHTFMTRCASQEIVLLLTYIHNDIPLIHNMMYYVNFIVVYIYKHKVSVPLKRKHIRIEEFKHYASITQLASSFLNLKSLLEVRDELEASQEPSSPLFCWGELGHRNQAEKLDAKLFNYLICCKQFWSRGKEVEQVLRPLFVALHLVNGDRSSLGYLYEAMEKVKDAITECCMKDQVFIKALRHLNERRSSIVLPIHAAAALLNPAYMFGDNLGDTDEIDAGIMFVLEHLVSEEEKEDFMKQLQQYRMKVSILFTKTAKEMLRTSHPRVWWEFCGKHLPVLQKHAVRILSQPCSTALCKPYELQAKKSDVHELKMKMMAKEKSSMVEVQDLEPIDLNKLEEYVDYTADDQYLMGVDWNAESMNDSLVYSIINDPTFSVLAQQHIPVIQQYHQLQEDDIFDVAV